MAKPIRATPVLRGIEADNFVEKMIVVDESRINNVDKRIVAQLRKNISLFKTY